MSELPMFPLGTVLFPGMPLSLRVFEPRYLALMHDIAPEPERAFGVVLIERGHEVGGGDARFGVGTIARLADVRRAASWLEVLAVGGERFEVVRWLPDDPYPRAEVRTLPELTFSDADRPLLARADRAVRAALARASEFGDLPWSPEVRLPGEDAELAWRLAGIAPLGPLDQWGLLRCATASELLDRLIEDAEASGPLLE